MIRALFVGLVLFLAGYGFASLALDVEVQRAARQIRQLIDDVDAPTGIG